MLSVMTRHDEIFPLDWYNCAVCGKVFNTIGGFDSHRYGIWNNRRCKTEVELLGIGMVQDNGAWTTPDTTSLRGESRPNDAALIVQAGCNEGPGD